MYRHVYFCILVLSFLAIDILTKYVFYDQTFLAQMVLVTPSLNTGVAWSLSVPMFIVWLVTVGIIGIIIYRYYHQTFPIMLLAIMLAGIIGNAYDRLVYGGVRDFIDLGFFPIFNIADVYITVGVLRLCICMFYSCNT